MIPVNTIVGMAKMRAGPARPWTDEQYQAAVAAAVARLLADAPAARLLPDGSAVDPADMPPIALGFDLWIDTVYLAPLVEATLACLFESESDDLHDVSRAAGHWRAYREALGFRER